MMINLDTHLTKHDAPACGLHLHPIPTQPYSTLSFILLTLHLFKLYIVCTVYML